MIPSGLATRLEKAAADTGFDQALPLSSEWLGFRSSHAPLTIWLRAASQGELLVALSRVDVSHALTEYGTPVTVPLPLGAAAVRKVYEVLAIHDLLRRAYQLAKSLPNELFRVFEQKTANLPRATEAERLVVQRVGQDVFRDGLLEYWDGRCAVTGLAIPALLRASHIKPWADCDTDAERLDVFNGLLLAPHLDAAFDQGFITVRNEGTVVVSGALPPGARELLALNRPLSVGRIVEAHRKYLEWHNERVFQITAGG
jgi:putative restriction endonuclease